MIGLIGVIITLQLVYIGLLHKRITTLEDAVIDLLCEREY